MGAPARGPGARRPDPRDGDYFVTKSGQTTIRCKAYTAPPVEGDGRTPHRYITTMAPGTYFGPVEEVVQTSAFTTVLVRGYWVNVWRVNAPRGPIPGVWDPADLGVLFATPVPPWTVASWRRRGWRD